MVTKQTKHKKLAKKIGLNVDLYFKREDTHPLGSHKGRSIPLMIDKYAKDGKKDFAISSSGNAAIAAGLYIKKLNKKGEKINLHIFVGKNIDAGKLSAIKKLADKNIQITQTENPKQSAFKLCQNSKIKLLRQSTDDTSLVGYCELAKELAKIKNLSAVFIPTSSGTTAQGLYECFKKLNINPQIHIVQTTACHPIAEVFVKDAKNEHTSLASAIVDKIAMRKQNVISAIKNSGGNGWIASNEEIKNAIDLAKSTEKIYLSPNSALSLVGLLKAAQANWKFSGPVVCLITGK